MTHVLAAFVIFSISVPDSMRLFGCIIFSAVGGLISASLMAGVAVFSPSKAQIGTTNGLMVQGSNMGHFFAPPFVALIITKSDAWEPTLYFMVGTALVTILCMIFIGRLDRSLYLGCFLDFLQDKK